MHSTKSDVWAVGAVVWALCTGRPPIKPLPEGFGRENWEVWAEMGEARMMDREVVSFGYGRALDQVVAAALRGSAVGRLSAVEMVEEVERGRARSAGNGEWKALVPWAFGKGRKMEDFSAW